MPWDDRIRRRLRLRDLDILMTVIQAGSMGKAADRLNMFQPTISKSIADLEHTLGVRLLDRKPQGVEPTHYALALIRRSAAAFNELKQGVQEIENLGRSHCRRTADRRDRAHGRRPASGRHRPPVAPVPAVCLPRDTRFNRSCRNTALCVSASSSSSSAGCLGWRQKTISTSTFCSTILLLWRRVHRIGGRVSDESRLRTSLMNLGCFRRRISSSVR